jgi:hypothetical protein
MRLFNNYPIVGRAVGISRPAKTLNRYPLMRKLAEPETAPAPDPMYPAQPAVDTAGNPDIQRQITENSVPSTRSDQFVEWSKNNPGGNWDQFKQDWMAVPNHQYTGSTNGTMYKAPTQFTGDIDSDVDTEMNRLRAASPSAYEGKQGVEALRRTATRNVFDANPNMDYDDLTAANSEAYTNKDTGGSTAGTNALAERMKFIQSTGTDETHWYNPLSYGIPRFTRNLFNPNEWSTKDWSNADTAATMASGAFGVTAPIYQAAKGVGNIYNTYQNGGYNGPDGFRFGRLGMDALRGGVNTTLSSFGVSGGRLGGVFKGMDNITTGLVRGAGKYVARPVVNTLGKAVDYAGRYINPRFATAFGNTFVNTARNAPRQLGQFSMSPTVLNPSNTNAFAYATKRFGQQAAQPQRWTSGGAYDALGSWINHAGRAASGYVKPIFEGAEQVLGNSIPGRLVNLGAKYIPQGAKNLARSSVNSAVQAGENLLSNNLFGVAEGAALNYGFDKAKEKTIGAQNMVIPTNRRLTLNTFGNRQQPLAFNTFGKQQPLAFNSRPIQQPFNKGRT